MASISRRYLLYLSKRFRETPRVLSIPQLVSSKNQIYNGVFKRANKRKKWFLVRSKMFSMNREKLLRKREKQDKNDILSLVLTYHPAINKVYEILKRPHKDTIRLPQLSAVLSSHSSVAFRNQITLKDHLVGKAKNTCL